MHRRAILTAILVIPILAPLQRKAIAHGGGLNSAGCHNNNKTGGYHCHRSKAAPVTTYTPPAAPVTTPDKIVGTAVGKSYAQSYATDQNRTAQVSLNALGYNVGPVDGVAGGVTQQAMIKFQRDYGYLESGIIHDQSIYNLVKVLAAKAGC